MRQRDNKTIPSRSQDLPLLVPYKHFPVNFSVDKMSNGCVYTGESHNPVDLFEVAIDLGGPRSTANSLTPTIP